MQRRVRASKHCLEQFPRLMSHAVLSLGGNLGDVPTAFRRTVKLLQESKVEVRDHGEV
jgi:hypothetical protein